MENLENLTIEQLMTLCPDFSFSKTHFTEKHKQFIGHSYAECVYDYAEELGINKKDIQEIVNYKEGYFYGSTLKETIINTIKGLKNE